MTWSIVARDPTTGYLGVAVASRFFAVGALVPHIRTARAAVATQAFISPLWGIEAADRLAAGESAAAVIADLVERDRGEHLRQIHVLDAAGRSAAHTGAGCTGWCGHLIGDGVSVAGNMLAGPAVVRDTMAAWRAAASEPFPQRLLGALEAGERAGGDKRGRQAAALRVHRGETYPWLDLRVDDHGDPLGELRRLLDVAGERFLHFVEAIPTAANFSGATDRTDLDRSIAAAEAERRAAGIVSRSFATPLPAD